MADSTAGLPMRLSRSMCVSAQTATITLVAMAATETISA